MILFPKTSANPGKYNQEVVTEKEAEMTDRIIQLENENAKLTGELEHVKALNLKLLKMINNQPRKGTELITVNKKLEAELAQVKLFNNELIKLINKSSFQQEQQEPNVIMTPPSPTKRCALFGIPHIQIPLTLRLFSVATFYFIFKNF